MTNDADLDAILKQMATEHRPELPSPGLIWFRAQIARKILEKERIEQPLAVMSGLASLVCLLLLVVFAAGNWGEISGMLEHRSWFLVPVLLLTLGASLATGAILLRTPAKREKTS